MSFFHALMNESFFRELEPTVCGVFAGAVCGSNSLVPASPAFPASSALSIILEDSNFRYPQTLLALDYISRA